MKRIILLILTICTAAALCACSGKDPLKTAIGEFNYDQKVEPSLEDSQGSTLVPDAGNTLIVVYMRPAEGNSATEDDARDFFWNGTKAEVEGAQYDLKCLLFEKKGGAVSYGLVFEVKDNGYSSKEPDVTLFLPESKPTPKPSSSPSPTVIPTNVPTTAPSVSPTESTATTP